MEISPPLRGTRKLFIGFLLVTIAFFACYLPTLKGLWSIWLQEGDYSYALLIPFITGYLLWEKREKLATTPISTWWPGGVLFVLFFLAGIYGVLGSSPSAVRMALPCVILSIALFCTGRVMFRNLAFPLSLFFFMVPLPTMFHSLVGVHLKRVSTMLGVLILRIFSIPVFVEGNIIDLGSTKLEVVDACSGLRYILPLLTIGVLFAYFFEKNTLKRIPLVAITVPVAIIVNGIRIGLTGILADKWGPEVAQGFFHGFSGWIVFMFALVVLVVFHRILKVFFHRPAKIEVPSPVTEDNSRSTEEHNGNTPGSKCSLLPAVLTAALLSIGAMLGFAAAALPRLAIRNGLSSFPLSIQEWHGRMDYIEPEIEEKSGAEDSFSGTYRSPEGNIVSLYLGYRGSPFTENENFFHSPDVCLPSSGWKVLASSIHTITDVPQFGSIAVRKMLIEKMNERCLVYYWFQTRSRTACDVNINRWHLTLHALARDNTHDIFFRLISPLRHDQKPEDAQQYLDGFTRKTITTLGRFLAANQTESRT
ncbi:MAG: VPLPA-CTERM-specific exosortase XrtD [bacterium]